MNCKRCGGDNPAHLTFCRQCGNRLTGGSTPPEAGASPADQQSSQANLSALACPRCGTQNAPGLRYCATCGTTLKTPDSSEGAPKTERGRGPINPSGNNFTHTQQSSRPSNPAPAHGIRASRPAEQQQLAPVVPLNSARSDSARSPVARAAVAAQPINEPAHAQPEPQQLPPRCWRCSSNVSLEAAFCQSCGADLRQGPQRVQDKPPAGRLIVIAQDGTPGRHYSIINGQLDVGREEGDIVLQDDPYVCPRHGRIFWKNGQFHIADLGSVNGIYARLNGVEPLVHGDLVLIGLQVLKFETVAQEEQAQGQAIERGTRLFGSPAAPRYARLVQRTVEGIARDVFYVHKTQTTIGRETGDLVFTDDPFMSRQHAMLTRLSNGAFTLSDLGSSNGTFIAIRNERPLDDGDHVRVGQHLFQLRIDG